MASPLWNTIVSTVMHLFCHLRLKVVAVAESVQMASASQSCSHVMKPCITGPLNWPAFWLCQGRPRRSCSSTRWSTTTNSPLVRWYSKRPHTRTFRHGSSTKLSSVTTLYNMCSGTLNLLPVSPIFEVSSTPFHQQKHDGDLEKSRKILRKESTESSLT